MTEVLLALVIVVALVLAVRWQAAAQRARELNASLGASARDVDTLRAAISKLEGDVSRLAKWEKVADADDAAAEMLRLAQAEAEILKNQALGVQRTADAATIRRNAEEEASAIRTEARTRAAKLSTETEARLADAEGRATAIIEVAHRKAEEVAGDALKAVTDAKALKRTVDALKNVIEGYGDRYVIPTHTLLHDLAEGFSHTDAGQKLKIVRERVRDAVRDGKAATCDYVEDNRRDTAVRFVIDAFTGKVDSILARVRQDNFGKLQQELRDAFNLVNHNGKAFRNARINESYRALCEEALHWATVVNELKQQEREEQRRIKKQIREEEKACASRIPNSLAESEIEAPLRGAWRLAYDNRGAQPRVVEGPHAVDLRQRTHGGPCRAEQCQSGLPLPGLGPAPSGGLTTNSRRTGRPALDRVQPTWPPEAASVYL